MTLQSQVCSLELAKKIDELGIKPHESLFYWSGNDESKMHLGDASSTLEITGDPFNGLEQNEYKFVFSAFTSAELGEMLWNIFEKAGWDLLYKVYGELFGFQGTSYIGELGIVNLMRKPDMAAKMLIYLLENKLI